METSNQVGVPGKQPNTEGLAKTVSTIERLSPESSHRDYGILSSPSLSFGSID